MAVLSCFYSDLWFKRDKLLVGTAKVLGQLYGGAPGAVGPINIKKRYLGGGEGGGPEIGDSWLGMYTRTI